MGAVEESSYITEHVAVIFGVTGIVGKELAKKLTSQKIWKVYGVARNPEAKSSNENYGNYNFISCDLLNPFETQKKLSFLRDATHLFWVTWASQFPLDSEECCEQNKAMLSNALNAILPIAKSLKRVSLQTGMKHYLSLQGPFDSKVVRLYNEECPRVSVGYNFYYVLEDLLKEKLGNKVVLSVHRPGLIMGSSRKTLYNFMGCLCVYGTICKELKLPFLFGGTRECWEEVYIDGSDARLVADQHIWAASEDQGHTLNAINGECFRWKEIWATIGMKFGVDVSNEDMFSKEYIFSKSMANKGEVWKEIVERKGLIQTEMNDLANWEFLDLLFRCPFKLLGTRDKADQLGFTTKYQTLDSILYWIDYMRYEKLIP